MVICPDNQSCDWFVSGRRNSSPPLTVAFAALAALLGAGYMLIN
jgi:hypothetical protein